MFLPWLQTIGVLFLIFAGIVIGRKTSKLPSPYWILVFAFPFFLLATISLVRIITKLTFIIPFSWLMVGRNEWSVLSAAVPMLFGILIPKLPQKRVRVLLSILLAVALIHFSILPFLAPALLLNRHTNLETYLADDVCLQTTGYTCGPASAVTALGQFGIKAEEGEMAVLAYTTPVHGTGDDVLSRAIEKRYGSEGISCQYRYFDSIEQLKDACPTIAVVKFRFFVDHYITVLEVTNDYVLVGDPLSGREKLTYEEFKDKWRFVGIVVKKQQPKQRERNQL